MWLKDLPRRVQLALGLAIAPAFASLQTGWGASMTFRLGFLPRTPGAGLDTLAIVCGALAFLIGLVAIVEVWRAAGDFERPLATAIVATGLGAMHIPHAFMTA